MDYHSTYTPWGKSLCRHYKARAAAAIVEWKFNSADNFFDRVMLLTVMYNIDSLPEPCLLSDHKATGRPVRSRSSSALLSVACKVDRTAGATSRAGTQGKAARSKETLQFLPDPTSFTGTSRYSLFTDAVK